MGEGFWGGGLADVVVKEVNDQDTIVVLIVQGSTHGLVQCNAMQFHKFPIFQNNISVESTDISER